MSGSAVVTAASYRRRNAWQQPVRERRWLARGVLSRACPRRPRSRRPYTLRLRIFSRSQSTLPSSSDIWSRFRDAFRKEAYSCLRRRTQSARCGGSTYARGALRSSESGCEPGGWRHQQRRRHRVRARAPYVRASCRVERRHATSGRVHRLRRPLSVPRRSVAAEGLCSAAAAAAAAVTRSCRTGSSKRSRKRLD